MAVIFASSLEARQAATDGITALTGTAAYSTAQARTGTSSIRCNPASGASGYVSVPYGPRQHFSLYIASLPSVERSIHGSPFVQHVGLRSDGKLSVYNASNALIGTSSNALTTGKQYWIGIDYSSHTGACLQVDGFTVVSGTQTSANGSTVFGLSGTEASAIDIYIDDIIVDDTDLLAPSKVDIALPIIDNSTGGWTGGAGGTLTSLWDAVNNTPPAGAATDTNLTNIKAIASTGGIYEPRLETYTTLGVGASDTVLAVQWVIRHGEDVSTGTKHGVVEQISNPASDFFTAFIFGDDSGAHGAEPGLWITLFGSIVTNPSITLGTSPTLSISRNSESRVGCVDFMGLLVVWTPQTSTTTPQYAQAQAQIDAGVTATPQYAQSQADIKDTGITVYAQATYDILDTGITIYAQSNAQIKVTLIEAKAQTQAQISAAAATRYTAAQSQANIKDTGITAYAQVQSDILDWGQTIYAQAVAGIKALSNGYSQARTDIKAISVAYGQSQADVKAAGRGVAQAQASIKGASQVWAQGNSWIKANNTVYAQTQADIEVTSTGFAQSQSQIVLSGKQSYAQSNTWIKTVGLVSCAQAQVQTISAVVTRYASGQALADIKQTYPKTSYSATVLADSPVAYWRLGEATPGTGTAVDEMGTNPGTYVVSPTSASGALTGDANTAVLFNGTTQYITVPDNAALNFGDGPMSIEAWAKMPNPSAANIAQIVRRGANGYSIGYQGTSVGSGFPIVIPSTFFFAKTGVAQIVQTNITVTDTNWHHIVATKTGATSKLYLDGVDRTGTVSNQTIINVADALNIGRSQGDNQYFPGAIDEVAVYNKVLSAIQVAAHYNAAPFGNQSPTFAQAQVQIAAGAVTRQIVVQVQADIKATSFSYAQSNVKIILSGRQVVAQTNAWIKVTLVEAGAQAQASILDWGQTTYAQAAVSIKATSKVYAQAQVNTKASNIVFALAQANVKTISQAQGQAGADIKQTYPLINSSAYSAVVLVDSPVAYWRLGEANPGTGIALDETTTNSGTYVASPASAAGALIGDTNTAVLFNGTTQYITIPNNASLNLGNGPLSVEAWAKLTAAVDVISQPIIHAGAGAYVIGYNTSGGILHAFYFGKGGAGSLVQTSVTVTDTVWHHIVITKNGATSKIYLDGVDRTSVIGDLTLVSPPGAINIGYNAAAGKFWPGAIDEVAIYDTALTPQQVQTHYIAGKNGATFAQAQAQITAAVATISQVYAQSQADIKTAGQVFGQAKADILQKSKVSANTMADIEATYWQYGQTQVDIKTNYRAFGQAMACVKGTVFAQSQADIKQSYQVIANAQADIKHTYVATASTQTDIKATSNASANAQTDIKSYYIQSGLSQTDIKAISRVYAQAATWIKFTNTAAFAQTQTDVKTTYLVQAQSNSRILGFNISQFAQAITNISFKGNTVAAQAQARIYAFSYPQWAQAQTDVKRTFQVVALAQAQINQKYQTVAQSMADIKKGYYSVSQAQAAIKQSSLVGAQVNAYIEQSGLQVYGQVATDIKVTTVQTGQATALVVINDIVCSGQAQVSIKQNYLASANTQADISQTYYTFAQSIVNVRNSYQAYAQAATYIIVRGITVSAQTQAYIVAGITVYAQARVTIKRVTQQYAQATVWMGGTVLGSAQAQVWIVTLNNEQSGQSQAEIAEIVVVLLISDITNTGWVRTVRD